MNLKEFTEFEKIQSNQNKKRMASYAKRYNLSEQDQSNLHMAFSPSRVPLGLTKLQVIRRISGFKRGKVTPPSILANRITIRINDKLILTASFTSPVPQSHRKLQNLVKTILWKSK